MLSGMSPWLIVEILFEHCYTVLNIARLIVVIENVQVQPHKFTLADSAYFLLGLDVYTLHLNNATLKGLNSFSGDKKNSAFTQNPTEDLSLSL